VSFAPQSPAVRNLPVIVRGFDERTGRTGLRDLAGRACCPR
jgi:hypothetical protein